MSRHLTFASSPACWLPEGWTDSYACGTPSFLGEKNYCNWGWCKVVRCLNSWFYLSGSQLACWRAILLPSPTSASPQSTVASSQSPPTALQKWFIAPRWGGWMSRRMMDETGRGQYFNFPMGLPFTLLWHGIHCLIHLVCPLVDCCVLYTAACWCSLSLQCFFSGSCPPEINRRCKGTRLILIFEWFCPCQGNDGWPWVTQQLLPDKTLLLLKTEREASLLGLCPCCLTIWRTICPGFCVSEQQNKRQHCATLSFDGWRCFLTAASVGVKSLISLLKGAMRKREAQLWHLL